MGDKRTRVYTSPLRDEQARRTQELILDAFTELLAGKRADDITTREIAERARVSQPTVYRHFSDRKALLAGLSARLAGLMQADAPPAITTVDEFPNWIASMFTASEDFPVEVTAVALLNSDPRRFSEQTRRSSDQLLDAVRTAFPELDDRDHQLTAGLLRALGSSQTWMRMREEFGVRGHQSGPFLAWAVQTLVKEIRNGEMPDIPESAGGP
jgi:AcrR family transcriptional regulator